jgi:hypothetical protein
VEQTNAECGIKNPESGGRRYALMTLQNNRFFVCADLDDPEGLIFLPLRGNFQFFLPFITILW